MTTHGETWTWMRSGGAAVALGAILAATAALRVAEPAERRADGAFVPAVVVAEIGAQPQIRQAADAETAAAALGEARSPAAPVAVGAARAPGAGEEWRLPERPGDGYLWSRGHELGR